MRRMYVILLLMVGGYVFAQPNYKYILQHMSEYSDREALYRLNDYRSFFPQEPHTYYLMGNIYYRLQNEEHALVDYQTKMLYLYNTRLFYGNCKAFLKNENPKADRYPEIAVDGKVNEVMVQNYLTSRIEECETAERKVTALYDAYCQMVNDYDTCQQYFSRFSNKYSRLKEAQMLLDEEDLHFLQEIKNHAGKLPKDILAFQQALSAYPIDGYNPTFSYQTIAFYRIDGLVGADFLQNEIVLWDYSSWVDEFESNQQGVVGLREELSKEYMRLNSYGENPPKKMYEENKRLLNNLDKYDEGTPMRDLFHLAYQVYTLRTIEQRIIRDSVSAEEWVISMQLAYRMNLLNVAIQQELSSSRLMSLSSTSVAAKYASFIEEYFPANVLSEMKIQTWSDAALNKQSAILSAANQRVLEWANYQVQQGMTSKVQISETMVAEVGEAIRFYEDIIEIQTN